MVDRGINDKTKDEQKERYRRSSDKICKFNQEEREIKRYKQYNKPIDEEVQGQNLFYHQSKSKLSEKTDAYYYTSFNSPKARNSNYGVKSFPKNHSDLNLDKGSSSNKSIYFRTTSCSGKDSLLKMDTNPKSGVNTRKISNASENSSNSMPVNQTLIRSILPSKYNKFNLKDVSSFPCDKLHSNTVTQDNTEILRLKISLNKDEDKPKMFSLRRYDNLKEKLKIFCETNEISERFIKPLEQSMLTALSNIFFTYNMKLDFPSEIYLNSLEMRCKKSKRKQLEKNYHSDDCYEENSSEDINVSSFSCLTDNVYSDPESCNNC